MIAGIKTIVPFDVSKMDKVIVQFDWSAKTSSYYKVVFFSDTTRIWASSPIKSGLSDVSGTWTLTRDIVSAAGLKNGKNYRIVILTCDSSGNESDNILRSSGTTFSCYSVPTITFENLTDGQLVNGTYALKIRYTQSNGRFMTSGQLCVYTLADLTKPHTKIEFPTNQQLDSHKNASGDYTSTEYELTITGLNASRIYYVQVQCIVSSQGAQYMPYTTEMYQLKLVDTDTYGLYNFMTATNNPIIGGIILGTDITSANGVLYDKNGDKIVIEDEDGSIIETTWDENTIRLPNGDRAIKVRDGNTLRFDDGWYAKGDFYLVLYMTHMQPNQRILKLTLKKDENTTAYADDVKKETILSLYYREGNHRHNVKHGYFELIVETKFELPEYWTIYDKTNNTQIVADEFYTDSEEKAITAFKDKYKYYRDIAVYAISNEPHPSWYRRVYHSNDLTNCTWTSYAGQNWENFMGADFRWDDFRVGLMANNSVYVIISRDSNYWSLDAVKEVDIADQLQ